MLQVKPKNRLKVYPTKTRSEIFFESEKNIELVKVYHSSGHNLLNFTPENNNGSINLSEFTEGTYYITFTFEDNTKTIRKFVKQ